MSRQGEDPSRIVLSSADEVVPWKDVPEECGFKIKQPGARGSQRHATADDQLTQQMEYTKHLNWARLCGINEEEFRRILGGVPQEQVKRGSADIASCLRQKNATSRRHAILVCQEAALRTVAEEVGREVGGDELAKEASEQLSELLSSESVRLSLFVQAPGCWCVKGGLNLPADSWKISAGLHSVPGLFEMWLRQAGAALMGAGEEERWRKTCFAAAANRRPILDINVPSHFSLDGAVVGALPTGRSHEVSRELYPTLSAWKAFAWEAACAEVRARFGDELEVRVPATQHSDGDQSITYSMSQLYVRIHTVPPNALDLDRWKSELHALHGTLTWQAELLRLCLAFLFVLAWIRSAAPRALS